MSRSPAVFLDKDGTLIDDVPYNVDPDKIVLAQGVEQGIEQLWQAGFKLVVVTNQSGIAQGYFEESALAAVEAKLRSLLPVPIAGFYYCPHHPEGAIDAYTKDCDCRKPKPGLLLKAAADLNLDLPRSWIIGDILNDVEAGQQAGCRSALVNNGNETEWICTPQRVPTLSAATFDRVAQQIVTAQRRASEPSAFNQLSDSGSTRPYSDFLKANNSLANNSSANNDRNRTDSMSLLNAPLTPSDRHHLLNAVDQLSRLNVLVIGEATIDRYTEGAAQRLCREAPVSIVDVAQTQDVPGCGANTAANAAALGAQTTLLSVIGSDADAESLKTVLAQRGVQTHALIAEASRHTLVKQRIMANRQLLVRFDEGTTDPVIGEAEDRLIEQLRSHFAQSDAVIVSDYGYGIITPRVLAALRELQADTPRVLVVDSKQLEQYANIGVTAVKPNYDETIALLGLPRKQGSDRIEQITRHGQTILRRTNAQMAALTLDVDGALTFIGQSPPVRTYARPAPNAHATGAGDTYVATLALSLAAGTGPHGASSLAAAATALTTREAGTTCCSPRALRRSLNQQNKRIADPAELAAVVSQHRSLGQRIVFTNGCFDILHSGHVTCLEQARSLGDILIVGVNSDESIRQLKGPTRPINALSDRLTVLAALGCVDYVVPFGDLSPRELIRQIRPDIYTKGGDYTRQSLPETPLIEELSGEVVILPYISNRSTTHLIEKIKTQ